MNTFFVYVLVGKQDGILMFEKRLRNSWKNLRKEDLPELFVPISEVNPESSSMLAGFSSEKQR